MKTTSLFFLVLICGLTACGGGSSNPVKNNGNQNASIDNAFLGIWTSEAYGKTYQISPEEILVYQHNSRFCLLEGRISADEIGDLNEYFAVDPVYGFLSDPGFNGVVDYHAPAIRYDEVESLPPLCDLSIPVLGQAGYQRDPLRDVDIFGQSFEDFYVSFELTETDWPEVYQQGLAAVNAQSSDAEVFELLYQMIMPLEDAHVHISSEEFGEASVNGKPILSDRFILEYAEANDLTLPIPASHIAGVLGYMQSQFNLYEDIILSYAEDENSIHRAANDQLVWFMLDDIAYLQIRAMTGFSSDPEDLGAELSALEAGLDQVLEEIEESEGLIVDVRTNNGGHDFLSMAIASRFVDSRRLVFSKQARDGFDKTELAEVYIEPRGDRQYLKPVALLTSNSTVSAAEVFSLIMRSLPQVSLVGESTQGALSDVLEKRLPNGFEFTISNEFYYSTEGEWFERLGIPVDLEIAFFTKEQRATATDASLEAAYFLLGNSD